MKSEYLDPKRYARLYQLMTPHNVLALRLSLETGLRIDDVLRLKKTDFVNSRNFVFTAKKTGKKGRKRISKDLSDQIFALCSQSSDYLFPGRKRGKHRTRQAVWKDLHQAVERAGLREHVSPHSARKTYAVELRKTEGLPAVQKELQHDRQATTMIYAFADLLRGTGAERSDVGGVDLDALAEKIARRVVELLGEMKKSGP